MDKLLEYDAFFGFENKNAIATGLGFGAIKGLQILKELMADYEKASFIKSDGSYNYTACPKMNTHVFVEHGLILNNKRQVLDGNILVLPTQYLCPVDYDTDILHKTHKTISIHWFARSWMTEESIERHKARRKKVIRDFWIHLPKRIIIKILGEERYAKLKRMLKRS